MEQTEMSRFVLNWQAGKPVATAGGDEAPLVDVTAFLDFVAPSVAYMRASNSWRKIYLKGIVVGLTVLT